MAACAGSAACRCPCPSWSKPCAGAVALQKEPIKAQIALRVDRDVLDRFRATEPRWQVRMNEPLCD